MKGFGTLMKYEYQKIFKRKSIYFAILLMLFVCTFCMVADLLFTTISFDNNQSESKLSVLLSRDREAQNEAAGYFDQKKITEVIEKNQIANDFLLEDSTYPNEIYNTHIRPFSPLRRALVQSLSLTLDYKQFSQLTPEDKIDFYQLRKNRLTEKLTLSNAPLSETETTQQKNSLLKIPFYYDYAEGYYAFLRNMSTSAVFVLMAVAICVIPIFSNEYSTKTDQLILTTKHGKHQLIYAKIITGLSFSALFTIVSLIISMISIFILYGTTGSNVSFQIYRFFTVYPINMMQSIFIYCGMTILSSLFLTILCLLFSSRMKSSFSVMITITVTVFGSLFIHLPFSLPFVDNIIRLLPAKSVDSNYIFSDRLVSFFGIYLEPYLFYPIIIAIIMIILTPFIYRGFKNHQA